MSPFNDVEPTWLFNVVDDFNREGLGIEVDFSLPAERVACALVQIIEWRGKPACLRCDNELTSQSSHFWPKRGYDTQQVSSV